MHTPPFPLLYIQVIKLFKSFNLTTVERRARVLTHQLSSLTMLAYTASLSDHKDAPMYGHTIGAITIAGQGELLIKPAWGGNPILLEQRAGDFYSFCWSYRDDGRCRGEGRILSIDVWYNL